MSVTIRDVAEAAGVSVQTVSRVINNKSEIAPETRERVQGVIDRLGYRPNTLARSLVRQRSRTIGVTIPDIVNPFFAEIVLGIQEKSQELGYTALEISTTEDPDQERQVLHRLEDNQVSGVISVSSRLPEDELLAVFKRHPAVVMINRSLDCADCGEINTANIAGVQLGVEHLVQMNSHKIAHIGGPSHSWNGRERLEGFRQALRGAGLAVDPETIRPYPLEVNAAKRQPYGHVMGAIDIGEIQTRALLERHPEVDAIVCFNDLIAIGAIRACQALRISVPEQVAVLGFDNILMGELITPSLTTLSISKYEMGARAAEMIIQKNECAAPLEKLTLHYELVVRASTARG
jgi:LacI family transcriptional regulator